MDDVKKVLAEFVRINNKKYNQKITTYLKKINCYDILFKKRDFTSCSDDEKNKINEEFIKKRNEIFEKYTEEQFDELLRKTYKLKKNIDWKDIFYMKKNTNIPTEKEEQQAVCKWLDEKKLLYKANLEGTKFGADSNFKYVSALKSMGMKPGVPDLEIYYKGHTIFVEMKRIKGGKVSEKQQKWIDNLIAEGFAASVCFGSEEAKKFITEEVKKIRSEKC
jgi:hypothetical protein